MPSLCFCAQYMKHKGYCDDLTEGKFSYPVIHSIHQTPSDHRVMSSRWPAPFFESLSNRADILKQKTSDHDLLEYAVQCIKATGSFEATVRYLEKVEKEARDEVARHAPNPYILKIVDTLSAVYKPSSS